MIEEEEEGEKVLNTRMCCPEGIVTKDFWSQCDHRTKDLSLLSFNASLVDLSTSVIVEKVIVYVDIYYVIIAKKKGHATM